MIKKAELARQMMEKKKMESAQAAA